MSNDTITNAEVEEILTKAGWDSVTDTWTDPPTATTGIIVGLARALLEEREAFAQLLGAVDPTFRLWSYEAAAKLKQQWEGK